MRVCHRQNSCLDADIRGSTKTTRKRAPTTLMLDPLSIIVTRHNTKGARISLAAGLVWYDVCERGVSEVDRGLSH